MESFHPLHAKLTSLSLNHILIFLSLKGESAKRSSESSPVNEPAEKKIKVDYMHK